MRWFVIAVLAVAALVVAGCGEQVETTHGQEVQSAEHEHGQEVQGEHHEEGREGEHKEAHEEESGPLEVAEYFCPMAACAVTSDEPGRCPKCGMELQMRKAAISAAGQETQGHEEHGE